MCGDYNSVIGMKKELSIKDLHKNILKQDLSQLMERVPYAEQYLHIEGKNVKAFEQIILGGKLQKDKMAGHSKFKNIMHRKGAQDKKRAKLFSRLIREISVSAKLGSPDPSSNPRLRAAINNALSSNMTKDTIDKAIKKNSSQDDKNLIEEITYEGFGPSGVAIIVESMTDNKNRSASEIRSTFSKYNGNLGISGSVKHNFKKVGMISYSKK